MLNISRVLREKGMTQGDLAKILGVSTQAVNSVVCGRSLASGKLLKRYADALEVDVNELYDDFL